MNIQTTVFQNILLSNVKRMNYSYIIIDKSQNKYATGEHPGIKRLNTLLYQSYKNLENIIYDKAKYTNSCLEGKEGREEDIIKSLQGNMKVMAHYHDCDNSFMGLYECQNLSHCTVWKCAVG